MKDTGSRYGRKKLLIDLKKKKICDLFSMCISQINFTIYWPFGLDEFLPIIIIVISAHAKITVGVLINLETTTLIKFKK